MNDCFTKNNLEDIIFLKKYLDVILQALSHISNPASQKEHILMSIKLFAGERFTHMTKGLYVSTVISFPHSLSLF